MRQADDANDVVENPDACLRRARASPYLRRIPARTGAVEERIRQDERLYQDSTFARALNISNNMSSNTFANASSSVIRL